MHATSPKSRDPLTLSPTDASGQQRFNPQFVTVALRAYTETYLDPNFQRLSFATILLDFQEDIILFQSFAPSLPFSRLVVAHTSYSVTWKCASSAFTLEVCIIAGSIVLPKVFLARNGSLKLATPEPYVQGNQRIESIAVQYRLNRQDF